MLCVAPTNPDDDYAISYFLSGAIPNMGLSLFVNAVLSRVVFAFNQLVPSVNWFFFFEYFSAFLATWAFSYAVLTYVPLGTGLAATGFAVCFVLPLCIASSNFTVVAGLCSAVGMMLLIIRLYSDETSKGIGYVGALLFALGMMWRFTMFLAALPFGLIAVICWVIHITRDGTSRAIVAEKTRPLFAALILCTIFYTSDCIAWQQPDWKQWLDYNTPRSAVVDFPMPTYAEAKDYLTSINVSENDYTMLTTWAGADTDVFPLEKIKEVASLKRTPAKSPQQILSAFIAFLMSAGNRIPCYIPILICLALLLIHCKRNALPMAITVVLAMCMCTYFALVNRLLDRVEAPVWCYVLCSCLAISAKSRNTKQEPSRHRFASGVVGISLGAITLAVCTASCLAAQLPSMNPPRLSYVFHQDEYAPSGVIANYIESHKDTYYLLSVDQYTLLEREYNQLYIPSKSIAQRVIPLGGWSIDAPFRHYQASLLGQTNVVAPLLAKGNPVELIAPEDVAKRVAVFLREHYDASASYELVDKLYDDGSASVWRFTSKTI